MIVQNRSVLAFFNIAHSLHKYKPFKLSQIDKN